MLIRIRSTGQTMYESEFRSNNPNTSFPPQISVAILNEFGADPVLNGASATGGTIYQYSQQDGVEEIDGKWFTKFILAPVFTDTTDLEGNVTTAAEHEAAYKATKDAEFKAANKAQAEQKLQATDWTQVSDVPLINKQAFTDYRAAVRAIALNPPVQATFPELPTEQWS
jgi:NACalpha-BTF3-like transcription factor